MYLSASSSRPLKDTEGQLERRTMSVKDVDCCCCPASYPSACTSRVRNNASSSGPRTIDFLDSNGALLV